MASYSVLGYTPPMGVTSREDVKTYQKQLGVTQDGVWGPKTQAAYEKSQGGVPQSFDDYYALAMSYVQPQTVSAGTFSAEELKRELESYLRPTVDLSITRRKEAARTANAELDADAVSRGMDQSTYVSSMKEREEDDVQKDVSAMEAQYSAALAEKLYEAMSDYQNRLYEAQAYNAQQWSNAQKTAVGLASDWYAASQTSKKNIAASGGAASGGGGSKQNTSNLTVEEIYELMGYLSTQERKNLFTGADAYWADAREELQNSVSSAVYEKLLMQFGPRTAPVPKAGRSTASANFAD